MPRTWTESRLRVCLTSLTACLCRFCRRCVRLGTKDLDGESRGRFFVRTKLARFVFDPEHIKAKTNRLKPKAFKPELYDGLYQWSTCQRDCVSDVQIWHLGNTCRPTETLQARADFTTDVLPSPLFGCEAPVVDAKVDFQEHALVVGWPTDREAQLKLQAQLAATFPDVRRPGT
jgi:hypothetical protein